MQYENTLQEIKNFYQLMDQLEKQIGGTRTLDTADGRMPWPKRGVYFFFESGEIRSTSGTGLRVVRIGTHALKKNSQSTLWKRLHAHQGNFGGAHPGGGNHRGSVFRRHVGTALIKRNQLENAGTRTWGKGSSAKKEIREKEYDLEKKVSRHIRSMPFLWLEVDDIPGPESMRGYIERNTIALLSNSNRPENPIDPPNKTWLGNYAKSPLIQKSGLWNVKHVTDNYDPGFIKHLERFIIKF